MALAIVETALNNVTPNGQRVRIVTFGAGSKESSSLGVADAPLPLRVFIRELLRLSSVLRNLQQQDDQRAIEQALQGQDDLTFLTLLELLRQELELGTSMDNSSESKPILEIRSIANSINRMAIGKL